MTDHLMEDSFQTNTFGFNLPCRQFAISAERTRERRMPMVDEFILRTLNIVESITVARLARFFGFDGRDMGIAISDLQARSLVILDGEKLSLHPSAKELFRTSDESSPTIIVTEPLYAAVWFDLITKNMVSGRRLRNVQHLISLRAPSTSQSFDVDQARTVFNSQFRDYLRYARNDKNADQWSLYSILDVHAGRYSYAQISGSEQLTLNPMPKLKTILLSTEFENPTRIRQLTDAMSSELARREYVDTTQSARSDFSRILGSDALLRATTIDGYLDLGEWIRTELLAGGDSSVPFVGHPYTESNRKRIASILERIEIEVRDEELWELWWLRPGGSKWGATEDLPATLEFLRGKVREWSKGAGSLSTTLLSPAGVQAKDVMPFQRVFDRGAHAQPGKFSLALEIMVIPEAIAIVTVMVALAPTVSVPIGCITTDRERVKRIINASRIDRYIAEARPLWQRNASQRSGAETGA